MDLRSKKVLVTGADGFIGSHMTEKLMALGCDVKALSQYNSFNNWGWLEQADSLNDIDVVTGDIRDPFFCMDLLKDVDIVIHLAALIAIPFSYSAPQSYIDTNINGSHNILKAALKNECARIIHTSTSEVYGTAQYVPIDEAHPIQAQSPYSASKIGADAIAMSYHNSFDLPVTIARPFNTFGPRQSLRAIIPTVITQLLSGAERLSIGDVSPSRDFNYVEDTCSGIISLLACDEAIGEVVNIGSGKEVSILDTVSLIAKLCGTSFQLQTDSSRIRPKNSEVFRLCCDNSKLVSMTGFQPDHELHEGLTKTIEWFREPENLEYFKSDIYNV